VRLELRVSAFWLLSYLALRCGTGREKRNQNKGLDGMVLSLYQLFSFLLTCFSSPYGGWAHSPGKCGKVRKQGTFISQIPCFRLVPRWSIGKGCVLGEETWDEWGFRDSRKGVGWWSRRQGKVFTLCHFIRCCLVPLVIHSWVSHFACLPDFAAWRQRSPRPLRVWEFHFCSYFFFFLTYFYKILPFGFRRGRGLGERGPSKQT